MIIFLLYTWVIAVSISHPVSVSIRRTAVSKDKLDNILIGMQHTLSKINQAVLQTSSVNNYNNDNTLYTCAIKVAHQTFVIDIDTGSADTIFRHPNCTSIDDSCNKGTRLNVNDSGITDMKKRFNINYNNGAFAVGKIYFGVLSIGKLESKIPIGAAIKLSNINIPGGILGLAFDKISQISAITGMSANFLDGMGLNVNMFSLYLSNSNDFGSGEIIFGGIDSSKVTGGISYYSLVDSGFWQFSLDTFQFTVSSLSGNASIKVKQIMVDSGTSMILLEKSVADTINGLIGGAFDSSKGIYRIDCIAQLGPDLVFSIGKDQYRIPASVYIMNVANGCISGISYGADVSETIIFGDIFIRQYYTVFDKTNNRIGFGLAVHN